MLKQEELARCTYFSVLAEHNTILERFSLLVKIVKYGFQGYWLIEIWEETQLGSVKSSSEEI
jgi:hypothetical protein